MPNVRVNDITMHYEQQGSGDPLVLIPFLAADNACYAFQVAEYSKQFTCISMDLRGTGESDKPAGTYSTELFADDVAQFMQALGIQSAHIGGLSLGAAVGMWLAVKYPEKVRSLSIHAGWTHTDPFVRTVVGGWKAMATALGSVQETVIRAMLPWCLTPELYASNPEYIQAVHDFVRSRPVQPVDAYARHCDAVMAHDIEAHLERITAPTQITVGEFDMVTSVRFAHAMKAKIRDSELLVFEGCAHAHNYEKVDEFNQKTLAFLRKRASAQAA